MIHTYPVDATSATDPPPMPDPAHRAAQSGHHGGDAALCTADMSTVPAPACPSHEHRATPATKTPAASSGAATETFADFEILRMLGEGTFGKVYLARQVSLDRQIALKVTANRGSEARTLASLEHDHIVQVFSETVHPERNQRLLCMQYVPGTTLERIIRALGERQRESWSGQAILDAIDALSLHPATFHPAALRDRELLADADFFQATSWIGARLAEALDYAHSRGVLHRDIKPANILVNQYGRPLLADFNISLKNVRPADESDDLFGGTLGYMAPEHIDAFDPDNEKARDAVDGRSDIYSLGIVLFEMLIGRRPFESSRKSRPEGESLRELAVVRRVAAPSPRLERADVPQVLDRVVRRCLDPDPDRRYQSGAELARALEGSRSLRQAERDLPPPRPVASAAARRPFVVIAILALLPHVVGSVVNISYNLIQIVGALTASQQAAYDRLVLGYNLIVYPACVAVLCWRALPAFQLWRALEASRIVDCDQAARVRRQVLTWPMWVVGLACVGWLPGGMIFPIGISVLSEPVPREVFGHFLASFTVSGLIALTYSFFGVQYFMLRVFYSRLWADAENFRATVAVELSSVSPCLQLFQILAGMIPLAGAVLLVGVGSEVSGERTFRILVTALIAVGMAGFGLAVQANNLITHTLAAFGGERRARPRATLRRME